MEPTRPQASPARATQAFERRIDALPQIVAFTDRACADRGVPDALRAPIDLAVEELFTNMVRHGSAGSASSRPIRIEIATIDDGVEVTLIDADAAPFDVTRTPDVDTTQPLQSRTPGGLGLHLTRRVVEGLSYHYAPERREARITFRKTSAAAAPEAGT